MCTRRRLGQSGQALTEYIFLLVVILIVMLGFARSFNLGMKNFMNSFADYLGCLVEYAELPGQSEDCHLEPFKMVSLPKDGPVDLGKGSNSDGKSRDSVSKTGQSGSTGRSSERSSNIVPFSKSDGRTYAAKTSSTISKENKGSYTGSDEFSSNHTKGSQSSSNESSRSTTRYGGASGEDSKGSSAQKVQSIPLNERDLKTAREIAAEKAKKKKFNEEDMESAFSIGNIFRYIIIGLMLFALIFFVGSQAVAMQRGSRRRR